MDFLVSWINAVCKEFCEDLPLCGCGYQLLWCLKNKSQNSFLISNSLFTMVLVWNWTRNDCQVKRSCYRKATGLKMPLPQAVSCNWLQVNMWRVECEEETSLHHLEGWRLGWFLSMRKKFFDLFYLLPSYRMLPSEKLIFAKFGWDQDIFRVCSTHAFVDHIWIFLSQANTSF